MKTLIFSGTPRENGDTMALVNEFISHLNGEYRIIDAIANLGWSKHINIIPL